MPPLVAAMLVGGCAAEVVRRPADFTARTDDPRYVVLQPAMFRLDSGYERTIPSGTKFAGAGRVREGAVLRPVETVFTIEGRHMHEAYLVLNGNQLVGFYLPVEKAFSPLSRPVELTIEERKN